MLILPFLIACAAEPTEVETPALTPEPHALAPEAEEAEPPAPTTIREGADQHGLAWPPPDLWIQIDKSDRVLSVLSSDTTLVNWPIGLGGAPAGDKIRQGDQKTPNGTFRIVTRNPKSLYHLFLGISYPDAADAERGMERGWLTETQSDAIAESEANETKPPWNTTLGGAIGIHGGGSSADWTLGCIALDNPHIEELWDLAPHGTRVTIRE
ncbi:MAG: L,D-transpeptidase family protein [Proteobacteria bacterium]|nr:L,D-transpeptidase family protein [Pseudomonadota bacterium]